jgi:uncharacterized protein (DUF1697 family)
VDYIEVYAALLRGINISGKNKISMPELKKGFEELGFKSVSTYINSGNVVFTSDNTEELGLKKICEDMIARKFSLTIPVVVISQKTLVEVIANAPMWWDTDKAYVTYAIFMIPPMTVDEVIHAVGKIKSEYEQIDKHECMIYWRSPRAVFNKSRWSKIAGSSVNNDVTIRNANTTLKLLDMMKELNKIDYER